MNIKLEGSNSLPQKVSKGGSCLTLGVGPIRSRSEIIGDGLLSGHLEDVRERAGKGKDLLRSEVRE